MTGFPAVRLRRLRRLPALRDLVRETRLSAGPLRRAALRAPRQETCGRRSSRSRASSGSRRTTAVAEARELQGLGIPAVILFGIPEKKDEQGSEAWDDGGAVQETVRRLKKEVSGPRRDDRRVPRRVHVARPLRRSCATATWTTTRRFPCSRAPRSRTRRAGADVVAPSDMMDGRVAAIRRALDESGFGGTAILSYAAKTASAFYGPFREAADSQPQFGDRRGYQMDPANRREAMREIALDLEEGADAVMVKPALAYLDVIREARDRFDAPIAAYNVSGEYAMVKAAAANGWIDERRIVLEILTGIVRAGADFVLTYHAKDAARWLKD